MFCSVLLCLCPTAVVFFVVLCCVVLCCVLLLCYVRCCFVLWRDVCYVCVVRFIIWCYVFMLIVGFYIVLARYVVVCYMVAYFGVICCGI